ncbi:SDR family oxidoreductase [Arthrobacter sp. R4-81]
MRTRDSVVVITGASSGIGRATALAFARKKARLVLAARRSEALESLAGECRKLGVKAVAVPTDVSDAAAMDKLAARAIEAFGRIDVWVNNAAVAAFGRFQDVPLRDFERVLEVNVMGYVHGARAALPHFRRQGSGVLINVSSVVAAIAQPYAAAYSISKAAVRALGVSLRAELILDRLPDVHVCTVLPAAIDTPIFQQAANYTGHRVKALPPVHTPQRVARTVVKLARKPRREAVVGTIGRFMLLQFKLTPGTMEAVMARQVDRTQLSRRHAAGASSGNLYRPSAVKRTARVEGGWHGRSRTARRRLVALTLLAGAGKVLRKRQAAARDLDVQAKASSSTPT